MNMISAKLPYTLVWCGVVSIFFFVFIYCVAALTLCRVFVADVQILDAIKRTEMEQQQQQK